VSLIRKHEEKLRFLVVGMWNTGFSLSVLWLLDNFIPYDRGSVIQKQLILTANWVIAVTQNFFTFKLLVFRTKGNWRAEYVRMYVTYAGTFVVQSLMVQALSAYFGLSVFLANLPTVLVVMVLSYLGHKYFTFSARHAIEAIDAGEVFEPDTAEERGAEERTPRD
jgi:putative flippase GtrA